MSFIVPLDLLNVGGMHKPTKPSPVPDVLDVDIIVDFIVKNKKFKLSLTQTNPPKRVYEAVKNHGTKGDYIRVLKGRNLRIRLHLSGNWDWTYEKDFAFTLKTGLDADYYYMVDPVEGSKVITVDVESKNVEPEQTDSTMHDQHFNLFFLVEQDSGPAMPVMFDPVIKNPPPDGD